MYPEISHIPTAVTESRDFLETIKCPQEIISEVLGKDSPEKRLFIPARVASGGIPPQIDYTQVSYAQDHNFSDHTMDDYMVVDAVNGIFIVADGVSRTKCHDQDAAWQTAETFGRLMHFHICQALAQNMPVEMLLAEAFKKANFGPYSVDTLNSELNLGADLTTAPRGACTAAVLLVQNGRSFIGTIGDCQVAIVDCDNQELHLSKLTDPQTTLSEKIREQMPNPMEFHRAMANKLNDDGTPDSVAYGVVNGDPAASHFFKVQEIQSAGFVYVFSDGITKLVNDLSEVFCQRNSIDRTVDEILTSALHNARLIHGANLKTDDSSLIRVSL